MPGIADINALPTDLSRKHPHFPWLLIAPADGCGIDKSDCPTLPYVTGHRLLCHILIITQPAEVVQELTEKPAPTMSPSQSGGNSRGCGRALLGVISSQSNL